jgi:acyl-coenzyme A thioesterase PaaI-like protein
MEVTGEPRSGGALPGTAALPVRDPSAPAPGSLLPSHYRLCIGCGEDHECGLHLQVMAGEGLGISGEFQVGAHHQGAPGLAHGGILATAVDEALGALNWLLMAPAVTARLEVDYVLPVPVGSTLHLSARIAEVSGRKVTSTAEGRLDALAGPVALRARGLFLQVPIEHFTSHGRAVDVAAAAATKSGSPSRPWLEINP